MPDVSGHPKAAEIARSAERVVDVIERECGGRPTGCPWRSYEAPDVVEALELHACGRVGDSPFAHVASVLPLAPSNALFEAVAFYDRALRRALGARQEWEREKRKAESRARAPSTPSRRR